MNQVATTNTTNSLPPVTRTYGLTHEEIALALVAVSAGEVL